MPNTDLRSCAQVIRPGPCRVETRDDSGDTVFMAHTKGDIVITHNQTNACVDADRYGGPLDFVSTMQEVTVLIPFAQKDLESLKNSIQTFKEQKGPAMLIVNVKKGARKDLSKPPFLQNNHKENLMNSLLKN